MAAPGIVSNTVRHTFNVKRIHVRGLLRHSARGSHRHSYDVASATRMTTHKASDVLALLRSGAVLDSAMDTVCNSEASDRRFMCQLSMMIRCPARAHNDKHMRVWCISQPAADLAQLAGADDM